MTNLHRETQYIITEAPSTARMTLGFLCALAAVASVALEHGFHTAVLPHGLLVAAQALGSLASLYFSGELKPSVKAKSIVRTRFGLVALIAMLAGIIFEAGGVDLALEVASGLVLMILACRLNSHLARTMHRPALLFPGSFIVLIAMSTCLLLLPVSTPPDKPIGPVDAIFTATSAVCVTGLIVRDTATGFTPFGQTVIAVSIQLGGLGVMIFGSTLAMLLGGRLSLRENMTLSNALDEYPANRLTRFAWFIVITTLGLELLAAGVLYLTWPEEAIPADTPRAAVAAFHSVSAFCNAGFDITGESLVPLRWSTAVFSSVMPLIILGGLGFIVLDDLFRWAKDRVRGDRRHRISLHTKIVITTTIALIAAGWTIIFIAQSQHPSASIGHRALDALFMSVTARTAGFTTVPMEDLAAGSRFMLMSLMVVGGSPGGTAGGLKTVVFAVLVLAVVSTIRGRREVEVFKRAIPDDLVKRAATIAFVVATLISFNIILLDLTESIPFEELLFEVISAATTTGLSLGATEQLTPVGRIIISLTMLLGRVGPLVFAASFVSRTATSGHYTYARDSVTLG